MFRNSLTQLRVKSLDVGKYADGQGLWLCKSRKDAGKWILRFTIHGRRREMGQGRWPDVSILEARTRGEDARRLLRDGIDPIEQRKSERRKLDRLTLAEAIEGCFEARKAELKNDGNAGRWLSPLSVHIIPSLGRYPVEDIDQHHLKSVLAPIWHTKTSAAEKALNRTNLTLKHAAALGLNVDLQATAKARALLGKQRHTVIHIPSLPYEKISNFYEMLKSKKLVSALTLRFMILTVARTSEIRFATFDEIIDDVWYLPPERTKTGNEHRIPLSSEAQSIVSSLKSNAPKDLLFPSPNGKVLSDAAMSSFMDREGYKERPHGFRATFRTWVEEQTEASFEVKEAAMGHVVGSDTVRAYQRSDLLETRNQIDMCHSLENTPTSRHQWHPRLRKSCDIRQNGPVQWLYAHHNSNLPPVPPQEPTPLSP